MNISMSRPSGGEPRTICGSAEKVSKSLSTVTMSSYRVTDQNGPNGLSVRKCTGASSRSRRK